MSVPVLGEHCLSGLGGCIKPGCMQPDLPQPHVEQHCSEATSVMALIINTTNIPTWPLKHVTADSSWLLIHLWVTYLMLHLRRSSAHSQTPANKAASASVLCIDGSKLNLTGHYCGCLPLLPVENSWQPCQPLFQAQGFCWDLRCPGLSKGDRCPATQAKQTRLPKINTATPAMTAISGPPSPNIPMVTVCSRVLLVIDPTLLTAPVLLVRADVRSR